jgi:sodium-dependent dicarboxylate transporter 2/3/5
LRKDVLKVAGIAFGGLVFLICNSSGLTVIQSKVAGITALMAFWWFTEAVDLYVTSLVPLVMFPILDIMSTDSIAPLYMKQIIFLFIGGFLFAFAMERWNLHRRIALRIIIICGAAPNRVLLGFMLSSYLLSMWIMNTAVVTMLLPAVLSVTGEIKNKGMNSGNISSATPYLLGITYASSIGGMATVIGTAPNLAFMEAYNSQIENTLNFTNWLAFALPLSVVLIVLAYFLLKVLFKKVLADSHLDMSAIKLEYRRLGKTGFEERILLMTFVALVVSWATLRDIAFDSYTFYGWGNYFMSTNASGQEIWFVTESSVAMMGAMLLFFIPARKNRDYVLNWQDAKRIPIGVLFLFGAGFTLGAAMESSGLAAVIAGGLKQSSDMHPLLFVMLACTVMTFLTELTSNTATLFLFIPIMFALQPYIDCHPLQLYLPVTITASCAFMLPVATPPNTIVFASDQLKMKDMVHAGLWLNLLAVLVISLLGYWLTGLVFA